VDGRSITNGLNDSIPSGSLKSILTISNKKAREIGYASLRTVKGFVGIRAKLMPKPEREAPYVQLNNGACLSVQKEIWEPEANRAVIAQLRSYSNNHCGLKIQSASHFKY